MLLPQPQITRIQFWLQLRKPPLQELLAISQHLLISEIPGLNKHRLEKIAGKVLQPLSIVVILT